MAAVASTLASLDELAGICAQRITAALPLMWTRRVSLHDSRGRVHWQSADVWGPAERDAVRLALEQFVGHSAPTRADHELSDQRTAVLLRAADIENVFRGFVMLVVDNRQLRGTVKSAHGLPVSVQRAAHDWGVRLAAAPTAQPPTEEALTSDLSPAQVDRLLAYGPTVDEPQADEFFARLRAFPIALVAQPLTALQRGMRIRRYEVLLREAASTLSDTAPLTLLREADDKGLGAVLDRRVAGALVVWLAKRGAIFADEPAQFSVNLSASSLADPNFLRFVELCIAKARIPPALMAFEVEQSLWRSDKGHLERLSHGIEAIGAGLVIDNCTLDDECAELLSLPAVRLAKIDRRLTRDLDMSKVAQMRVAGIAQIARVGGVYTVAKQVELLQEQDLLRALGVDFVQGHATAVPTPLDGLDLQRAERLIIDAGVRGSGSCEAD